MADNESPLENIGTGPMQVEGPLGQRSESILPPSPSNSEEPTVDSLSHKSKLPVLAYRIKYWDGVTRCQDYAKKNPCSNGEFLSYVDWLGNSCFIKSTCICIETIPDNEKNRKEIEKWAKKFE